VKGKEPLFPTALEWERGETDQTLSAIGDELPHRPTTWVQYDVDLRFRLHRFPSHYVEHTIQRGKTVDWLGTDVTEAARAVRRISAMRGRHERGSEPGVLEDLASGHEARLRDLRIGLAQTLDTAP